MPRPEGRDRLEGAAGEDGSLVLLSRVGKPWAPRTEGPGAPRPGTAVRWEDQLYEVVSAEVRASGGWRYVLAPWDERAIVRTFVTYGATAAAGDEAAPEAARIPPASAPDPAPAPAPAQSPASTPATPAPSRAGGLRAAWQRLPETSRILLVGAAPTALLWWFLPVRVMGEGMSFFVHELGHTAASWLFGRFALPAVVVTIAFQQNRAAAALIWALIAFAAIRLRKVRGWGLGLAVAAAAYPVLAFTPAHETVFDLAGHGAEIGVAAWFLRRAVRGGWFAEWERPVSAMLAFWLWFRNARLFAGLVFSAAARTDYLTVSFADRNDLVKVAESLGLRLEAVALGCLVVALAVPALSLALALRSPREAEAPG